MASGGREPNIFSSDDEDLHCVKKRSKRPKAIVSSDSDSDSDKDFDKRPRKNVRPLDLDSDDLESDKYSNETSFSNETRVCSNSNEDSSLINDLSDNEQSEKCAICLGKFAGQDIATPETCDHTFCLECLREWAKNVNTCPIDRLKFNLILVRHHKEDKICKRISVNSPDSPWLSESESESIFPSETALCASCGENDDVNCLFTCHECEKAFHARCLTHPSFHLLARSGICPDCAISISVRRFRSDRLRRAYDLDVNSPNVDSERSFNRRSYIIEKRIQRLLKARVQREFVHIFRRRRQISSSESSDEDTELTNHSAQQHRDRLSSRSQCPLHQKRRLLLGRSRNQTLVSTAASATSNSELYSVDSDDGNNEYRYDNRDHEQSHHGEPSSSTRSPFSGESRTKIIASDERENYDLVGSILQTQTLILRPDVIKLQRDGTVLLNSDLSTNSRMNSSASSSSGNEERFIELPSFSNSRTIIPHTDGVTYKQQPLNPTQNSNSKYRETDRENYSCTSSSTSKEPSIDCDNVSISSRNAFQNSGNERYNDNSCSSVTHKNFCSSSATEDIKKVSNFKESNKVHHSEDEVDIYSDIESVGDDEGVCSTIEGVGDRIESMELSYKGDQSPSSNPEAATDSSDNELVIDEDMAAEDESENRKESIQMNNIKNKCENEQINESEESNVSYSDSFNEQQKNGTPDVEDNNSCVDSRSVEDGQLGEESSQETFHSDGGAGGYKADSECDESKYGSECDESKNGSEYEENKNDSECEENKNEYEYEENKNGNEYEENKNGSEYGEEKNRSEDEDNNESVAGENKNVSEYDDQESDMDVQVYEDNSLDSSKKSPRAETSTPCSTISSSKQYDEEMKEQESLDQCDNSVSSEVQEFDESNSRKDSENADVSLMQTNENTCGSFSQAEENENYQNENNSNLSFESSQNVMSESEEAMDSNIDVSQTFFEGDKKELDEVQNEIKSAEYSNDEKENEINDVDFSENASTPCLDENIDGQIEDSPIHNDTIESTDPDFNLSAAEYDPKSCRTPPSGSEYEMVENDEVSLQKTEEQQENHEKTPDNVVDLGIEDISEAGSGDLDDDFADENASFSESKEQAYDDAERDHANYEYNDVNDPDSKVNSKHSDDAKYQNSSHSNQSFEEREEGEIVEDKPARHPDRKRGAKFERYNDDNEDYGDLPRVNISDLPRIPKIKRDKEKESVPEELPIENKRTSVLGRVDLGGGDISWKRLSKHTRERSYRDGRPKEERVLYRERESRKRDKKYSSDNEWRSDSKSSRRDDSKKDSEKLRSEYDSRSRKNDRKESKASDWDYSDRDKRNKSHKDKHKDKHRDKKEKTKHDKGKHSKDDMKYSRDRGKDDERYERELKLEKEQRFERVVHEKGKCKDKDHKNKHKDRKNDNKSGKDHSREKHKHIYVNDHFSEKQREREVRKIDDKLKIVVEQKEGRKEKSKHKDKKESKHDKKQIHHHEHRKKEVERSPYTELTSIESKEIFAKGDSIIINVSFNRTNSPKDTNIDNTESSFKDKKSEEFEVDDVVTSSDKNKKHSLGDKGKTILDTPVTKRPVTPPERTNPVLSVSECYWQGGEDSDANSADSEKSVIEITNIEEENDTMESANPMERENSTNSFNSNDATESQTATKETVLESDKTPEKIEKVDKSFVKESENLAPPPKRRSPRSPSPPSPADNDSYDPCEPTRSPSPPPMPPAPPLPAGNPKPPPSPELPPLPPEPEPIDNIREETIIHMPSEFAAASSVVTSSQPVTVNTQTSVSNPISMPSMLLPPPSFMSHTPATTNSLPSLSSLLPPNFSFQVNNHPNVIFQSNHVQQVLRGIVPSQIHATSAIPPPPNPPSLPHMGSVPPPPPPPSAMALISQVRHPQMNVRPTITPNQILQNLTMGHPVTMSQMQLTHLHHLPPNLSNALNNHQSPMMIPSQNQSLNLPISIQNQPVSRVVLSQNQMLNHSVALQNQNMMSKPQGSVASHQSVSNNTQKSDKVTPEKTEVIDMDVDSPYSPGDSPSMDSVCDYSPTCSPLPSSPKNKDIFDSLLPTDHRTSDRKTQDMLGKGEKSKRSKNESDTPNKRAKSEHKRHSVRMQLADKNKSRREQRIEKKLDDSQLKILDELPSSAVEMQVKEKFLKKLNRQERVVEEVKLVLKPYYKSRDVTKEEYKDILRKSVPKICHNKSGEINPVKVKSLVESYVKKIKHSRKKSDKKKSSKLS